MKKSTNVFLAIIFGLAIGVAAINVDAQQNKVTKPLEAQKAMPKASYQLPDVSMVWQHEPADYKHIDKFKIFAGLTKETAVEIKEIKYEGQPFTATVSVPVTADPGATVRFYFAVQTLSKSGNATNKIFGKTESGIDYLEFIIPKDVADPFSVIIKVVVK
jgi:hypothetical protein